MIKAEIVLINSNFGKIIGSVYTIIFNDCNIMNPTYSIKDVIRNAPYSTIRELIEIANGRIDPFL